MARRRKGVMSEELKYTLAKELGFYDTVRNEGWGGIRAKDAGNMVKRALQIAEKALAEQQQGGVPAQPAVRTAPAPSMYAANTGAREPVGASAFGGAGAYGGMSARPSAGTGTGAYGAPPAGLR